jgi:hypothetical protein
MLMWPCCRHIRRTNITLTSVEKVLQPGRRTCRGVGGAHPVTTRTDTEKGFFTGTGKVVFFAPRGAWTQHGDVCGCAAARSGAPISSRPHEHKWHSSSSSRGEPRALQPSAARLSHGSPPFAMLAPTPALSAKNEKTLVKIRCNACGLQNDIESRALWPRACWALLVATL